MKSKEVNIPRFTREANNEDREISATLGISSLKQDIEDASTLVSMELSNNYSTKTNLSSNYVLKSAINNTVGVYGVNIIDSVSKVKNKVDTTVVALKPSLTYPGISSLKYMKYNIDLVRKNESMGYSVSSYYAEPISGIVSGSYTCSGYNEYYNTGYSIRTNSSSDAVIQRSSSSQSITLRTIPSTEVRSIAVNQYTGGVLICGNSFLKRSGDNFDSLVDITTTTLQYGLVCWSPELRKFIAIEDKGANSKATLIDDLTYADLSDVTLPQDVIWKSICWSPELCMFILVGHRNGSYTGPCLLTSRNGTTWTACGDVTFSNVEISSVTWDTYNARFIITIPSGVVNSCYVSYDGYTFSLLEGVSGNVEQLVAYPEINYLHYIKDGVDHFIKNDRSGSASSFKSKTDKLLGTYNKVTDRIPVVTLISPDRYISELSVVNNVKRRKTENKLSTLKDSLFRRILYTGYVNESWTALKYFKGYSLSIMLRSDQGTSGVGTILYQQFDEIGDSNISPGYYTTSGSPDIDYQDVCIGGSSGVILIAVGLTTSTNAIVKSEAYSADTWVQRTSPTNSAGYTGVCYNDLEGVFVCVGPGSCDTNIVARSVDNGASWTGHSLTGSGYLNTETKNLSCVAYSKKFNVIVAGDSVPDSVIKSRIIYSTDGGLTWSDTNYISGNRVTSICWSDELEIFVCSCASVSGSSGAILYSKDGVRWVKIPVQGSSNIGGEMLSGEFCSKVVWDSGLKLFIGTKYGSTDKTKMMYSTDGLTWVVASIPSADMLTYMPNIDKVVGIMSGQTNAMSY